MWGGCEVALQVVQFASFAGMHWVGVGWLNNQMAAFFLQCLGRGNRVGLLWGMGTMDW